MLITRMEQYNDGSPCDALGRCTAFRDGRVVARYNVDIQLYTDSSDTITVPMCERHVAFSLLVQADERAKREREAITTT